LLVQPSLFDRSRAPSSAHTAWAYCHVPHGSDYNASGVIEATVERFAPGFRDVILARAGKNAAEMQAYNPNYVGGDINGGEAALSQLFFRPVPRLRAAVCTACAGTGPPAAWPAVSFSAPCMRTPTRTKPRWAGLVPARRVRSRRGTPTGDLGRALRAAAPAAG
jgi:phytoene dehydrogenase-like protein